MKTFTIQHYNELPSTNTMAQQQEAQGAEDGLVIVADYQSEGRGKPGREWVSPAGKNLLFSILLRPDIAPHEAPMITQTAGRSVAKVLETHGIESTFKRPNDIMVNGKKICGVLVESSSTGDKINSIIIGIGLNVNAPAKELVPEAASMKELKGREFDREKILQEILDQLREDLKGLYDRPS